MTIFKDVKQILKSFRYAGEGFFYVLRTQRNMQIHFAVAFIVIVLAVLLQIPMMHMLFVIFSIVFVMGMELINTAIERTIDLITSDYHPLAKLAKDIAAGAVLFAALFAFFIGIYVFGGPLLKLLYTVFG